MVRLKLLSHWIHGVILLALALPYFIHLGTSSIWDANESFYAETPREMLETGDYLSPQFNYQPRAQKPPLTYWAILVSYKILGINEWAVRLPGAIAALGILLFSYGAARALSGPRAALIAAAIAATTPRIFILERRLPIDILLLFFLTGTLFFIVRAISKRTLASWLYAYAFAALGFMTKGPIAAIIPGIALLAWMLYSRKLRFSDIRPLQGLAVFICLSLPYYLLIYRAHGWLYIAPFFLGDNLGRFASETMGPSRSVFYYIPIYLSDFFPWSFIGLAALFGLRRKSRAARPFKSVEIGLPVFWCAIVFLIFSLSKNKQEYYIAPMYPAAAVFIAGILDRRYVPSSLGGLRTDGSGERSAPNTQRNESPAQAASPESYGRFKSTNQQINKSTNLMGRLWDLISGYYDGGLEERVELKLRADGSEEGSAQNTRRNESPVPAMPGSYGRAWNWIYGSLALLQFLMAITLPYILESLMPGVNFALCYAPSIILAAGSCLMVWSVFREKFMRCFVALAFSLWVIFLSGAIVYVPILESFRPVKGFCREINAAATADDEAGFFRVNLPSMTFYLRRQVFNETDYARMLNRLQSDRRVFCVMSGKDHARFTEDGVTLHILDRHPHFSIRFGGLFSGDQPERDLLLVSNHALF